MPPGRKGRGLGPFTSAQPAAGPLLGSQLVWPQTTQNSRSWRSSPRPMSTCGAWPGRCAPPTLPALPTDVGPPTCRTRLAHRALTATEVAVLPGARRLDRGAYCPTSLGCTPGGGHVGSQPLRRQLSAASPSQPRSRPSGSRVGQGSAVAWCRREAAPLLLRGMGSGPEVWRGIRRLLLGCGEQPRPSAGPSPRPACVEVARQPVRPVLPFHSVFRSALLI
jgi:hypothetical protein